MNVPHGWSSIQSLVSKNCSQPFQERQVLFKVGYEPSTPANWSGWRLKAVCGNHHPQGIFSDITVSRSVYPQLLQIWVTESLLQESQQWWFTWMMPTCTASISSRTSSGPFARSRPPTESGQVHVYGSLCSLPQLHQGCPRATPVPRQSQSHCKCPQESLHLTAKVVPGLHVYYSKSLPGLATNLPMLVTWELAALHWAVCRLLKHVMIDILRRTLQYAWGSVLAC